MKAAKLAVFLAVTIGVQVGNEVTAQSSLQFYSLTPCRAVDTRGGTPLYGSQERQFPIRNICGVDPGAKAVTLNVTAANPSRPGFFTMWPSQGTYNGTSILNVVAGQQPIANGAVMAIGTNGSVSVGYGTDTGSGTADLILDVTGYFK